MTDGMILSVLKSNLELTPSQTAMDLYLTTLIGASKELIAREGIELTDSIEDGMLVVMYAAYLYRKRGDAPVHGTTASQPGMPRMLRYALNNRLFAQKAKTTETGGG